MPAAVAGGFDFTALFLFPDGTPMPVPHSDDVFLLLFGDPDIAQVRETSLATGSAASQVLSSSTQLEHQAASLKQMIEQFRSQADGLLKDAQDRAAA